GRLVLRLVRPSFKTGLHCGPRGRQTRGDAVTRPPVLQDGPPLRLHELGLGRYRLVESARPSRRASIAAFTRRRRKRMNDGVRPSFKTGLHCGYANMSVHGTYDLSARPSRRASIAAATAPPAAPRTATVRPSFKTGLHCGQSTLVTGTSDTSGPPVLQDGPPLRPPGSGRDGHRVFESARPSRRASIAASSPPSPARRRRPPVRPSFKTGLHCGAHAGREAAPDPLSPPVLQDGPPLRPRRHHRPHVGVDRSARPSRRASIAARSESRGPTRGRCWSARPSRRASIAARTSSGT
ncbi:MAG: hypothetical protein QOE45_1127, partial [Frankiaceae bacterium]|nr:hypothetical protein [Frankiaceae bacterium]